MKKLLGYIFVVLFWLTVLLTLTGWEKDLMIEQVCCDWNAVNFDPDYNGHNVNQLYFTGSDLCNNDLCLYPEAKFWGDGGDLAWGRRRRPCHIVMEVVPNCH